MPQPRCLLPLIVEAFQLFPRGGATPSPFSSAAIFLGDLPARVTTHYSKFRHGSKTENRPLQFNFQIVIPNGVFGMRNLSSYTTGKIPRQTSE
jgi:hypothetical protein